MAANHFVQFTEVTRQIVEKMDEFLSAMQVDYNVVIEEKCTDRDLSQAQYLELLAEGHADLDEDENGNPLNQYPPGPCQTCFLPRDDVVANPLLIRREGFRKTQDIHGVDNGVLIVSQRFMSAVAQRLADSIHIGNVVFDEPFPADRLKDRYFWVRPKFTLGKEVHSHVLQVCETCGAPREVRKRETGDRFRDAQIIVEHFGDCQHDLALSGNWYGERTRAKPMSLSRSIYISSEFYRFLKSYGLRGIVRPEHVIVCDSERKI